MVELLQLNVFSEYNFVAQVPYLLSVRYLYEDFNIVIRVVLVWLMVMILLFQSTLSPLYPTSNCLTKNNSKTFFIMEILHFSFCTTSP